MLTFKQYTEGIISRTTGWWHGSDTFLPIGKVLQFNGNNKFHGNFKSDEIEILLEKVRLEVNPTAPSRFNCIFVTNSDWVLENMNYNYIYAISLLRGAKIFQTSYQQINRIWNKPMTDEELHDAMVIYWRGGDGSETLVSGGIRIIARHVSETYED
jgi:hypothetical protein